MDVIEELKFGGGSGGGESVRGGGFGLGGGQGGCE